MVSSSQPYNKLQTLGDALLFFNKIFYSCSKKAVLNTLTFSWPGWVIFFYSVRESLLKGTTQCCWPPCTKQFGSTSFDIANMIYFYTKQATLMMRSTVLSLPLQLMFPDLVFIVSLWVYSCNWLIHLTNHCCLRFKAFYKTILCSCFFFFIGAI